MAAKRVGSLDKPRSLCVAGLEVLKRDSRFSGGGYETSYPLRISGYLDLADIRNCTTLLVAALAMLH
eukprot:363857-Chlamydomonas_euryale.AAC.5